MNSSLFVAVGQFHHKESLDYLNALSGHIFQSMFDSWSSSSTMLSMMAKIMIPLFCILFMALAMNTDQADAERCAPTKYRMIPVMKILGLWRPTGYCDDNTRANPCCGNGKCDVFCRNCVGGCRKKKAQVTGDETKNPAATANRQVISTEAMDDMTSGSVLVADTFHPITVNAGIRVMPIKPSDPQIKRKRKTYLYDHLFGSLGSSLRRYGGEFGRPYGIGYGRPNFSRPAAAL
ncbi:hypothetical protein GHT06_021810 [Daphnia sinensis]|uniref:Uncharacterized protein n=1 Tax=Daphnia sinensis TaxID=1820382 RepID=A0AAD5PM03_9CRUS|nr:hypothetical protein GHT06_021810 [Daphnia sinensis]